MIYTQDLYRALKEAVIKVENDNSLWNEEWLIWKADAQDALNENTPALLERRCEHQLLNVRKAMLKEITDFMKGKTGSALPEDPAEIIGIDYGYEIPVILGGPRAG